MAIFTEFTNLKTSPKFPAIQHTCTCTFKLQCLLVTAKQAVGSTSIPGIKYGWEQLRSINKAWKCSVVGESFAFGLIHSLTKVLMVVHDSSQIPSYVLDSAMQGG